jgi:hypothetical protein
VSDPFRRFGIEHLSASSLNTWRAEPALWCVRYLHKVRDESGPAAMRGNAVEAAVVQYLRIGDTEDAKRVALDNFENNALGDLSDEMEAERAALPEYVEQACRYFSSVTAPLVATQLKVELWLDDVPIPVIGYADLVFESGDIRDLKTTHRIPSEPKPDHGRQASIYRKARNAPSSGLVYVSPKKSLLHTVDDTDAHIAALRRDALGLMRFLDRCANPLDAIQALPVNTDGFMWGAAAKAKVAELFV